MTNKIIDRRTVLVKNTKITGYLLVKASTILLLIVCLLLGGASRISDYPIIIIRPLSVLLIGIVFLNVKVNIFYKYRFPLIIYLLFSLTILIQLIPLPPHIWYSLPLSHLYEDAIYIDGISNIWRPISIAPDLTINSLLSILPSVAIFLATIYLSKDNSNKMLNWVMFGMLFSAVLGLSQFSGGNDSHLYIWADRSEGVADGVFANRNHQAIFLSCGLALLGPWVLMPSMGRAKKIGAGLRVAMGAALGILLMATVIATGSRTGTMTAIFAAFYSCWTIIRSDYFSQIRNSSKKPFQIFLNISWLSIPIIIAVMLFAGKALSLERFASLDALADQRVRSTPVMINMAKKVFPFGSGYGTFDTFFRAFEPDDLLHYGYFNHAHNDFLELLLTGGLAAVIVVFVALVWWSRLTLQVFVRREPPWKTTLARSSSLAMLLVAVASAVDYPMRTPLMGGLIAILAIWLVDGSDQGGEVGSVKP